MSDFVSSVFGWLSWFWVGVILAVVFAELAWLYVVVLRAMDLGYDKERCDRRNVDYKKAMRRRISWMQLGFPLFLLLAALLILFNLDVSFKTYLVIATLWFVTAPLRKMWGIAIARKVVKNRGEKLGTSYWQDVRDYYSWGFRFPERPQDKQWFEDKLAWLNKFQNLWYAIQIIRFWGVVAQLFASLVWPVAAVVAVFYHMEMVDDYDYDRPWWRFDRKTDQSRMRP